MCVCSSIPCIGLHMYTSVVDKIPHESGFAAWNILPGIKRFRHCERNVKRVDTHLSSVNTSTKRYTCIYASIDTCTCSGFTHTAR